MKVEKNNMIEMRNPIIVEFLGLILLFGQEVYAPCNGIVLQTKDGYKERSRTNLFLDTFHAYKNAHYFDPEKDDEQRIAGNYIVINMMMVYMQRYVIYKMVLLSFHQATCKKGRFLW